MAESEAQPVEKTKVRRAPREETALANVTMTPGQLAAVLSEKDGIDVDKLATLMELQERHEAIEARKAYTAAMVTFRGRCPTIIRDASADFGVGKARYSYATLPSIIEQIQPLMVECGLAATWMIDEQSPTFIKVTCVVSHVLGHREASTLGGAPDASGGKNQLHAIKSTVSYLRRTTLGLLLGLVDREDIDNDGAGGAKQKDKKSPSQEIIGDPEKETKRAFVGVCRDKTGNEQLPTDIVLKLYAAAQVACGSEKAADCLTYIKRLDVIAGQDGTLSAVTDSEPDFKFECSGCHAKYKVKPANAECIKCFDPVVAIK